jgi:putative glutamine amidotransferase
VTTSRTVQSTPERSYLNSSYVRVIQESGGIPIPLLPPLSKETLREIYPLLDGVLLTGGGDIDPRRFGEPPHPTAFDIVPERDELELRLVEWARAEKKPLLAICRGVQLLNVALGGSLYQDLPSDPGGSIAHSQQEPSDQTTHKVSVVPGSALAEVVGTGGLEVNSLHHQGVNKVGKGLLPVATAPDGIIEGLELAERRHGQFFLGVQWHPEELVTHHEPSRRLFSAFLSAAVRQIQSP